MDWNQSFHIPYNNIWNMSGGNSTDPSGEKNPVYAVFEVTFLLLVASVILSGNILVLIAIVRRPDLQVRPVLFKGNQHTA